MNSQLIQQGRAAYRAGDFSAAAQMLGAAKTPDEIMGEADHLRGNALMHLGMYAEAAEAYAAALNDGTYGKRGALLLSYGLSFILNIILFFLSPENASSTLVLVLLFGTGIFNGFCTALLYGMIGDTVEYGQWKTGVRADGLCSSGTSFMLKLGGAIAPTMLLAMLAANGYAEGAATQTAGALSTMNVVMNLVPAILAAISFILFVFYKLDNKLHAQIIQDLKDRGQYVVEE